MNITLKDFQNFQKEERKKQKIKEKESYNVFSNLINENDIQGIKEFKSNLYYYFSDKNKLEFITKSINNSDIFEYLIYEFCDSSIYGNILNICLKNTKLNGLDALYEIHKKESTESGFYDMVISEAVYYNNLEIVNHCISKGSTIRNALKTAIDCHKFEIFQYLIELNRVNVSKDKLLKRAFENLTNNDFRFITEIVKRDKNIDEEIKKTFFYYTPKSLIAFNKYVKSIELEVMSDITLKSSLFLEYTRRKQKNKIASMLKDGISPNIKGFNYTSETPIEIAIEKKDIRIIKELIDYGVKINNWEDIKKRATQEIVEFIDNYPRFSKLNKELQSLNKVKKDNIKKRIKI